MKKNTGYASKSDYDIETSRRNYYCHFALHKLNLSPALSAESFFKASYGSFSLLPSLFFSFYVLILSLRNC